MYDKSEGNAGTYFMILSVGALCLCYAMMEIQTAYMNEAMDAGFAEMSRIADRSTAMLTKAGAPLQSRFDEMVKAA